MTIAIAPSPSGADAAAAAGAATLGASEFAAIAAIMQAEARIHLSDAKRTLVQSRLSRRLREHRLDGFRDYVRLVQSDPQERHEMVVALTTNHTHFFRENHHFDHVRDHLLPAVRARVGAPVRVWSAGCSSGEEVYTLAMCLLGRDRTAASWLRGRDVRLLATDLSPPMVEAVVAATYAGEAVAAIPAPYRAAWVRELAPDRYVVAPEARALVTARVLNLFGPWPMRQRYDAIFCRNVMIYFDDAAKAELEARLIELLAPGGFLYIGHSERLAGPAAAQMAPCGQTIYVKHGAA